MAATAEADGGRAEIRIAIGEAAKEREIAVGFVFLRVSREGEDVHAGKHVQLRGIVRVERREAEGSRGANEDSSGAREWRGKAFSVGCTVGLLFMFLIVVVCLLLVLVSKSKERQRSLAAVLNALAE